MNTYARFAPLLAALLLAPSALAERGGRTMERVGVRTEPNAAGVSWFGTWDAAVTEAKRTKRPILLMSATPTCNQVPGVW